MDKYESNVVESALELAADCIPPLSIVVHAMQFPGTVSDAIFVDKLRRLLNKQDRDILNWIKIEWKFESDHKNYSENVKKLIYLLDSMRENQSIDVYANLLHSYQCGLIERDAFFRLSWIVSQIYYDDLLLLRKVNGAFHEWNHSSLSSLQPYGLLETHTERHYNGSALLSYSLTRLGQNLLDFGINFNEKMSS